MSLGKAVIISAFHDFRTLKRASVHHIATGLVDLGYEVSFISTRYSHLSRLKGDSRLFLWPQANTYVEYSGVKCYLQRTPLHPFSTGISVVDSFMPILYKAYASYPDSTFDDIVSNANFIIVESSVAVVYISRIRKLNQNAKIIYYATDLLETVGAHTYVNVLLEKYAKFIDHACVRSEKMAPHLKWASGKIFRAEFGINEIDFDINRESPFEERITIVGLGSMLFDATFFQIAAPLFPEVDFHMIGAGVDFAAPSNVFLHREMSFEDTLPYVRGASVGVAPYRNGPGVEYLADSSLKLAQFEFLGIPTVCPSFAVGDSHARFGYQPGDAASIQNAINSAISKIGKIQRKSFPSWPEVAARILRPEDYPALRIGDIDGSFSP